MTGNAYQRHAMRTNDEMSTARLELSIDMNSKYDMGGIVMATMGLSGEVGELNDMIKKWIFHKSDMDITHAKKELGDILWYVACMAESFGWSLDEIMKMNIDKLKARYPEGFDIDRANHKEKYDV
jgi:NTP pyrophosphatase (non-canonical NTP hydrolase)